MNEKELSEKMKREAVKLGLCRQWTDEWELDDSKGGLVEKFIRGLDFCIQHDWPSVKEMKRYFGDVMRMHGVYADENVSGHNLPMVVLNGECVGELRYDNNSVGEVYVRHESEVRIKVDGLARVFVNVYDDGEVSVDCDDGAKCFVYLYGGCAPHLSGEVIVRDKRSDKCSKK